MDKCMTNSELCEVLFGEPELAREIEEYNIHFDSVEEWWADIVPRELKMLRDMRKEGLSKERFFDYLAGTMEAIDIVKKAEAREGGRTAFLESLKSAIEDYESRVIGDIQ